MAEVSIKATIVNAASIKAVVGTGGSIKATAVTEGQVTTSVVQNIVRAAIKDQGPRGVQGIQGIQGIQGEPGVDALLPITSEVPTGTVNGSNQVFTTAFNFVSGSTRVYLNGVRQYPTDDYTETDTNEITMVTAPTTTLGQVDKLLIDYYK